MGRAPAVSPMLGRDRELEQIDRALTSLAEGDAGEVLFVEGEAGIGKSRLVEEAIASAEARGAAVRRGWADELEQERPFGVVFDALRPEVSGPHADAHLPRRHDGAGRRHEVVDAIAASLEELALRDPLLLALEDLQWADESSIAAISRLTRTVDSLRVLLVLTARPTPRSLPLHRLAGKLAQTGATMLRLEPLSADQGVALAEARLGRSCGPTLRAQIARGGGNPFFVIELVDALAFEGELSTTEGGVDVKGDIIPPSLLLAIVHRLRSLSTETLELVRLASVLAGGSRLEDVATVAGRRVIEILPAIDEAAAAGVFSRTGGEVRFRHDLVREAVYQDLPEPARRALHGEAARALATAGAPPLRVAAQMQLAGAEGASAVKWFRAAGDEAAGRDPALAAVWYRRALDRMGEGPDRSGLLADLARVLLWDSRHEEASAAAEEALATARDPDQEWQARLVLARVNVFGSRQQEAIEHLDVLLERDLPPAQRAILLGSRGQARSYTEDLVGAAEDAERALELGQEVDSPEAIVLGGMVSCLLRYYDGRVLEASAVGERAVAAGRRATWEPGTVPFGMATANVEFAAACLEADRVDEARQALKDVLALYRRNGVTMLTPVVNFVVGLVAFVTGDWDDALAELEAGLRTAEDYDNPWLRTLGRAVLAQIEVHRDNLERARTLADEVDAALVSGGATVFEQCLGYWAVGSAREAEGDIDLALDRSRHAWSLVADAGLRVYARTIGADHVRLEVAGGDRDKALAAAAVVHEVSGRAPGVASARAVDLRCRGLAESDPALLLRAVKEYAKSPRRPEGALAAVEFAELAGAEAGSEGVACLQEAAETLGALGATRDLNRALAALRALGVRAGSAASRARPQTGWESLTPTERRVVDLVAEGLSNPKIAERLFISRRTVESHLARVFPKLGVTSRSEIIAAAARRS